MITQTELKERLEYNPDTGLFTRLTDSGGGQYKGSIAGHINNGKGKGYVAMSVYGRNYAAHRLVWLYVHGYFPEFMDHINGCRHDNRLENLREVTRKTNAKNLGIRKSNTSGFTGVNWQKLDNKWQARITIGGETIQLGYFINIEDAIEARKAANIKYNFHPNHGMRDGFRNS